MFFSVLTYAQTPSVIDHQVEPQAGGVFRRYIVASPQTLNPFLVKTSTDQLLQKFVSDFLAIRNPDTLELEPRLAEKWTLADDSKTLTVQLRSGIKFVDGSDFSAEDVAASFETLKLETYRDSPAALMLDTVESVQVQSPLRLLVKFKKSSPQVVPQFFENLVLANRRLRNEPVTSESFLSKFNSLGPYKVLSFEPGKSVILERRADWYGFQLNESKNTHFFGRIEITFSEDRSSFKKAVKRKQHDLLGPIPMGWDGDVDLDSVATDMDIVTISNQSSRRFSFILLNVKKPELASAKLRLAMAHCLNRDEINNSQHGGALSLLVAPQWPFEKDWNKDLLVVPFSPSKAAELLKEEGWLDEDKDGTLEKKVGSKVQKLELKWIYSSSDLDPYFKVFSEDLARVGIKLTAEKLDWVSFLGRLQKSDFDGALMAWESTLEWNPRQLWHSKSSKLPGANFSGYSNSQVDLWIERAENARTPALKQKNLAQVYKALATDLPALPLFVQEKETCLVSKKIGRKLDSYKYKLADDSWWLKTPL